MSRVNNALHTQISSLQSNTLLKHSLFGDSLASGTVSRPILLSFYPLKDLGYAPDTKIQLGLKQIFDFGKYSGIFKYNFRYFKVSVMTLLSHQCVQHVRNDFTMLDHA